VHLPPLLPPLERPPPRIMSSRVWQLSLLRQVTQSVQLLMHLQQQHLCQLLELLQQQQLAKVVC
jgi:hypothetical protein